MVHLLHTCPVRPGNAFRTNQLHLAGPISIQSGIRHSCRLSMALYALCLHSLIRSLEANLPGLQTGRFQQFVPVLAYADDVMVFVSHPAAFVTIRQAIRCFELAEGARHNPTKSKALATGAWMEPATLLGIDIYERVDILGVTFGPHLGSLHEGQLNRCRTRCARSNEESLCSEHELSLENTLCPGMPACKNLVCFESIPTNPRTCPASHDILLIVHLTRHNLSDSYNYP